MPEVHFSSHLLRHLDLPNPCQVEGDTLAEVVRQLESQFPGFAGYVVDERGRLRKHVNLFIGEKLLKDRQQLSDVVTRTDQVYIMQALSGG